MPKADRVVVCIKHPLAWLDSVWRHGWVYRWMAQTPDEKSGKVRVSAHLTFDDFVEYRNAPDRWNECYLAWTKFSNVTVLRHEDLLHDPSSAMAAVSGWNEGPGPDAKLLKGTMGYRADETFVPFSPDYYRNRIWENQYDTELRERTLKLFDPTLRARFRYA